MSETYWDYHFLKLAEQVAQPSHDPSVKVGAIIVRGDRTICSTGYNGFPRTMEDRLDWYEDREAKLSRIIHAEMNALLFAREPVEGYTLYTWPMPSCCRCTVHVIQAGITRMVSPLPSREQEERWGDSFEKTRLYASEVGIALEEVSYGTQG